MKKEYVLPEVKIEQIIIEDIIAASGFGSDLAGDLGIDIGKLG